MAQFDDLVAKYRNLTYGRLAGNNPSAIQSLLNTTDKSISNPQYFGNIDPQQQQFLETPSGFIAQNQFQIDPNTGIPMFQTPTSEAIAQGIEMGGGSAATYDPNIDYGDPGYAGVIPADPVTGLVGTTATRDPDLREGRYGERGAFGKGEPEPSYNPNLLGQYFGYNNPNYAPSPLADASTISDYYSRQQRNVDLDERISTNPTTYGYTGPVKPTGFLGALSNIGKDKVSGKGTPETTKEAYERAVQTEKEIAEATKAAADKFAKQQKATEGDQTGPQSSDTDASGGISDAQKQSGGSSSSGGTGSIGAGGAAGRAKGGKYGKDGQGNW